MTFELLAGPFGDPIGGVAWTPGALLFSRPESDLIQRLDASTQELSQFRCYTNHTAGLAFAPSGELYGCQRLSRRVVRFNADGSTSAMPYRLPDSNYHNMPRHLVVDRRGRIWFSDPLSTERPASGPPVPFPGYQSVLRLEQRPDRAWALVRATFDTVSPSGVALSPDERTLYVADGAELRAYPIQDDGRLGAYTLLHTFGQTPGFDGLCVSTDGTLLACARAPEPLLYVLTPRGRILRTHALPDGSPTVCATGESTTVYVGTATGHVWRATVAALLPS